MDSLQESAAALLLRSPRLSVSTVLELLDISDAEFRTLMQDNRQISELLEKRKRGELTTEKSEARSCPVCEDLFTPYAGRRYCSDECTRIARISSRRLGR